jgi:signal transduction histidine kinase
MEQRAQALGGSCTIESAPGAGTEVLWKVPSRQPQR